MQTVQIESFWVSPSFENYMEVGFKRASYRCHIIDYQLVRQFGGDFVLAAIGAQDYWIVYQENINRSKSSTQSSQTLRATSAVLLSTSRYSQTPLELSKVLLVSAKAFSECYEI
jgi:hypothetical protein